VAENCTGSSNACPSNGYVSNGTTCDDGNAGTCNDACSSGTCGGGSCGGSLDPVVKYAFSEGSGTTAADSSGNALSATLSGATFAAGYSGNGVRIAGGTQRVNLPANVVQSCTNATGFTIAARVNLATNGTNWSRIYDIGSGTTNYMFLSPRASAANILRFAMKVNNGAEQMVSYTYTFPTATWKHVAVTLNGNTATMYLDGAQVAQNTGFTYDPSGMGATANNWLGDSQFSADPQLDGTIDDFQISCRALSAAEIQTLAGVATCTPTTANCEYQMASGSASVEAEHYYAINNQGSTDAWTLKTAVTQASGSQCMEISGGTDGNSWTTNVATTAPKMDYKVNFTTTGQFYLHVKADANSGGVGANDSCWVGIDGVVNATYIDIADAANTYGWTTFNLGTVSSTGVKTVTIYGREDGFRLDKMVISSSATTPTGNGPSESVLN
jgi:hypothetical protein